MMRGAWDVLALGSTHYALMELISPLLTYCTYLLNHST